MPFRIVLAAIAALLAVAPGAARAAITYDTTTAGMAAGSGLTNSLTYGVAGSSVTMTATGYYLSGTATTLARANVGSWGGGLGVCNSTEGTSTCSSPSHQVDNLTNGNGGRDFILLQFTEAVNIQEILVQTFSSTWSQQDTDIVYYLGNVTGTADLTKSTFATLTASGGMLGTTGSVAGPQGTNAKNRAAITNVGNYNVILVGVPSGQTNDAWKMASVTVNPPAKAPGVPEPMSLALLATGLIGLGVASRRARRA